MDISEVRKLLDELAAFMEKHELGELELEYEGAQVKLRKAGSHYQQHVVHSTALPPASAPPAASPAPQAEPPLEAGTIKVTSPMVGTFYRAPKPDSDPFVELDDEVSEDTVVCIIEAMKVMNEIKAEHKGRIVKLLIENGEPVEYGQPLFVIAVQ